MDSPTKSRLTFGVVDHPSRPTADASIAPSPAGTGGPARRRPPNQYRAAWWRYFEASQLGPTRARGGRRDEASHPPLLQSYPSSSSHSSWKLTRCSRMSRYRYRAHARGVSSSFGSDNHLTRVRDACVYWRSSATPGSLSRCSPPAPTPSMLASRWSLSRVGSSERLPFSRARTRAAREAERRGTSTPARPLSEVSERNMPRSVADSMRPRHRAPAGDARCIRML